MAGMKLTAVGSGYFVVSVNGTDVSNHTTEREAIEASVNRELGKPDDVVEYRHDYKVKVEEEVVSPPPPPPTGFTTLFAWDGTPFPPSGYEVTGGAVMDAGAMKITSFAGSQGDKGLKHLAGAVHQVQFGKTYRYTWSMQISPSLRWSNQRKMKAYRWIRSDGGTPTNVLTGYLGQSGFWPGEHGAGFISDQGAGSGDEGPTIPYSLDPVANPAVTGLQQYQVEMKVQSQADARDGYMIARVNGAAVGQLTGIRWFSGSIPLWNAWGGWGMFFYPQDADGVLWSGNITIEAK